jgi:hypothetical protein
MTGTVGILLAVIAGWFVSERRQVVMVVVLPFLAVLAIQTWGIAAGRAVSAPSTVTAFPDLIGYYVVQAIILALTLGIALQISALRFGGSPGRGSATLGLAANMLVAALVVGGFRLDRPLLDPGSTTHHSSSGPPLLGIAGIALSAVVCAGLGCLALWRRWFRPRSDATAA